MLYDIRALKSQITKEVGDLNFEHRLSILEDAFKVELFVMVGGELLQIETVIPLAKMDRTKADYIFVFTLAVSRAVNKLKLKMEEM